MESNTTFQDNSLTNSCQINISIKTNKNTNEKFKINIEMSPDFPQDSSVNTTIFIDKSLQTYDNDFADQSQQPEFQNKEEGNQTFANTVMNQLQKTNDKEFRSQSQQTDDKEFASKSQQTDDKKYSSQSQQTDDKKFASQSQQTELQIKEEGSQTFEIPCGLQNSNNDCYKNAVIQAIASSEILIQQLDNLKINGIKSENLNHLVNLLMIINLSYSNIELLPITTNQLQQLVDLIKWNKSYQQDPFDFLSALINNISKDFEQKKDIEIPLRIKLLHEFQGINIKNKIQEYVGLSLNLCGKYDSSGVLLQFLINNHFESTRIDGNESKLTRLSIYKEIPSILLIHIQANKWDPITEEMVKPIYQVEYEENMTLWFDVVNEVDRKNQNLNEDRILGTEVQYNLKAVVHHFGSISGGHYFTQKKYKNEWYLANDQSVTFTTLNKTIPPYIMIYERSLK